VSGSAPVKPAWKGFFWLAAAYNVVIGLGSFLAAPWGTPEAVSAVLIVCFGIVYGMVAYDPRRFAPVLIAGVLGKAMVVAMFGPPNWFGNGDSAVGLIVAGDLIFMLGFMWFLLREKRHA
jgi:hypothetical protein